MKWLVKFLATGLGVGFAPVLSGTWGSLLGIPLFWGMSYLGFPIYFLTLFALTLFAIWISSLALPLIQDAKKPEDPSCIVIDEVVGVLWAAGIVRYAGFWKPQEGILWLIVIPFILFRIFDASKFWLVGWAEEKYKGGLGIVVDDVVAGIMAGFVSILFCVATPFLAYMLVSLR